METVGWRLRGDLELHSAGDGLWVLKDPLRLSYFQVSEAELNLLQRAGDGKPLERLSAELAAAHPEFDWSLPELRRFLAGAVRSGLMCANVPGNRLGNLRSRAARSSVAVLLNRWWSLVSFRWRGVDPSGLLRLLSPVTAFLLQPAALCAALLLVLLAVVLVFVQREVIVSELPGLARLLAPSHLILMTIALVFVRGLHELGHAAVCSYFGGECRELGVQLTIFIPFPYCDVSDSWLWPERWKRMAVAGAGMAVEFVLAAICTLLWTSTYPGLLHDFCLNVMLLCSLNTLLVNGNPLLRYDGYYLLSDFCRVPNLAEAGNEEAVSLFRRLVLGEPPMFLSERSRVARICIGLYGVAAAIYRLTITASLLALVFRFVEPSGLGWAAIAPGIAALSLNAFTRMQGLLTHLRATQSGHRVGLKLAVAIGLLITLLCVPVSIPLRAPFVLIPGNAVPVFVRGAGQVEWLIQAGSRVKAGDVLARLTNGDLELKIAEAEGDIARRTAAAAGIRLRQLESGSGDSSLAAAEELLESARRRLQLLKLAQSELIIRSPRAGIVFPARNVPQLSVRDPNRQSLFRSSEVLDGTRRCFWLQPQTQLCTVGEYSDLRALACVRQTDVELLSANADASLRFDSLPSDALAGLLEAVSDTALQTVPPELTVAQRIPTDATGAPESGSVWYPLTVRPMNIGSSTAPLYATGTAFLEAAPASVWSRIRRLAGLTFSLPF